MKIKNNRFLKFFFVCIVCCLLFIGTGYYFIDKNLKPAQNQTDNIPYSQKKPENAGVLVTVNAEKMFFYLDFENESIIVSLKPQDVADRQIYGYSVDFYVDAESDFIKETVDYLGGIELENEKGDFRYTGAQVTSILSETADFELRKKVICEIFEKISEQGVEVGFFVKIIENSKTDLTLPECYFWAENFAKLSKNLRIID